MAKQKQPEKRGRGRPSLGADAKDYVFGVRLDAALTRAVKAYGQRGGDLPSEVRTFIARRMKAEGLLK